MRQRKSLVSASNPDGPGHSLAEETEEIMDKVNWMKYSVPSENPSKHLNFLKDTHHYRRQWMESGSKTITDILQKFPRFQDMPNLLGTSIDATTAGKDEKYVQPYILSLGPALNPSKFFIVVDRIPIPAGNNIIQAVDRLFKAHYAFNVHYALALLQFWEFLAAFLYGVIPATSVKVPLRSLASNIKLISPK
ncbi:hypothetical protein BSL78_08957 [Apostichopus japonicus]|uniref:Uncharacterized protein n=1 Tax=Stichopus japonicus TaxID=307972 RepID=A0A2G8L1N9_STIJA|nr:hypothetical protein BSL78_08957 [Apostichopus japonicus]